jgi:hypothetical protein
VASVMLKPPATAPAAPNSAAPAAIAAPVAKSHAGMYGQCTLWKSREVTPLGLCLWLVLDCKFFIFAHIYKAYYKRICL